MTGDRISFREVRPIPCHELCEMVFDQLVSIEDLTIRQKLGVEIITINDILLGVELAASAGKSLDDNEVSRIVQRFDNLVQEIDRFLQNSSTDRYCLEVVRQYPADIWRSYIANLAKRY